MWPTKPRFKLRKRLVAVKRRRKVEVFLHESVTDNRIESVKICRENKKEEFSFRGNRNCGELV